MALTLMASQASADPPVPGNLILQVPDWNQPYLGAYPNDINLPGTVANPGYPGWCSPTAGANLMGYWEDVKGYTGLTDRLAFGATTNYPATFGTWQQGLYHDGVIEMGWKMNTGGWRDQKPSPSFPPFAAGTNLVDILTGLLGYAQSGWTDNSYLPPPNGTGIVKVPYAQASGFTQNVGDIPLGTLTWSDMWTTYCNQINVGHPAELSFDTWIDDTVLLGSKTISGFSQNIEERPWVITEAHSVVGVGYIDLTPGVQNNGTDEWFVCQDGWQTTGQYVAVPMDLHWMQNDYITVIPEPSTLVLLVAGAVSALIYGWRCRRTAT